MIIEVLRVRVAIIKIQNTISPDKETIVKTVLKRDVLGGRFPGFTSVMVHINDR